MICALTSRGRVEGGDLFDRVAAVYAVGTAASKGRRTALALLTVLFYLLLGRALAPPLTPYWGYHVAQTVAVLTIVLVIEAAVAEAGGLAWQTHALIVATLVADVLGNVFDLYHAFPPYDKLVHFGSGAVFGAAAFDLLAMLELRRGRRLPAAGRWVAAVAVSFLVAGVAWETYEALGDALFRTDRVQSREDTVRDLVCDVLGAAVAAGLLLAKCGKHRPLHAVASPAGATRR